MAITYSIFPKYFPQFSVRELAAMVRETGLDTVNLVIRDGYWVSPENLAAELPLFMRAVRAEGLEVRFATAGFEPRMLLADPTPLALLAEHGIRDFRLAYSSVENGDVRASLSAARAQLEQLAPLCERYGVRAIYQLHYGTLVPNPSAVWPLVQGLPPQWIGVELDPGNQSIEGYEDWERSAQLLREYVVAVGIKDSALVRDADRQREPNKGWRRFWVPIYEGVTNWHDVTRALHSVNFNGTFVFMPFYEQHDPAIAIPQLKREVSYLRNVVATVESKRP
jgi:sugar phosphate isomerase/epimerase